MAWLWHSHPGHLTQPRLNPMPLQPGWSIPPVKAGAGQVPGARRVTTERNREWNRKSKNRRRSPPRQRL